LASKLTGYNAAYEAVDLDSAACALFRPGKNTIAVHTRQTTGGQYIDLGIEGVAVAKTKAAVP